MNILVANLGSTSFKFRLIRFDGAGGASVLAKGGYERVTDYGRAIDDCLGELKAAGHVTTTADLHGVGFKTVLGKNLTGCLRADTDDRVIAALDGFKEIAPAHNPPYALGIARFREKLPGVPLVALFETAFYQTRASGATVFTARATSSSPSAAPNSSAAPTSPNASANSTGPARRPFRPGPRRSASFPATSAAAAPSPASATASPSARAWASARSRASRRTTAWATSIPPPCRS
jgi:hypothetical protein